MEFRKHVQVSTRGNGVYYEVYEGERYLGYSTFRFSFQELIHEEESYFFMKEMYEEHGTSDSICKAVIDVCFMYLQSQRELIHQRECVVCEICQTSLAS
jgi:hypothetical protein